jgi:hypothetical protein
VSSVASSLSFRRTVMVLRVLGASLRRTPI